MKKKRAKKILEFASKKQVKTIAYIEDTLGNKFKGETQKEVSDFIEKNLYKANFINKQKEVTYDNLDEDQLSVTTTRISSHNDSSDYEYSISDSLAFQRFKSDIMRGKDARVALMNLKRQSSILENDGYNDFYGDTDDYYAMFDTKDDYDEYMDI